MFKMFKKNYRSALLGMRNFRTRLYHFLMLGKLAPEKDEILYIDPQKIKGHMGASLEVWQALIAKTGCEGETVVGGNWDRDHVEYLKFTDLEVYKSCYSHWIDGEPWEQTPFYQEYIKFLKIGRPNRFASLQELKERYENLDKIFATVNAQREMSTEREDLVKISISRDGKLIWGPDGKHRVSMALCLGLEKIPARVGFIHADAIEFFQGLRTGQTGRAEIKLIGEVTDNEGLRYFKKSV